ELLFAICAASTEPLCQHVQRRRLHENRQCPVFEFALQVEASLYVDVEDDMLAHGPYTIYLRAQCAIEGARVHLFKLDEFLFGNPVQELFLGDEIIIFAIYLALPCLAGARRNGKRNLVWVLRQQALHDGGLTGAGGSRKNDEFAFHVRHSTFSSCSLIFSS